MRKTWPWGKSLSFRLNLAINLAAAVVLIAFWTFDYRREQRLHLDEQTDRLREEAKTLAVAQDQLGPSEGFARYLDAYCRQMEESVSPGHHIAVVDHAGQVIARAHSRADAELEARMLAAGRKGSAIFGYAGRDYLAVGVATGAGETVLVAQSLTPVRRVMRRQAISRAASMTVLVAIIIVLTNFLLIRWVRRPIEYLVEGVAAVRNRRFDHRVPDLNSSELQFLADGFNQMSVSLGQVERQAQQEMEKARRIHFGLLPSDSNSIPGLCVAAKYLPAKRIGGDYYDILACPDGRWLLAIADVSGHGLSAALVMAMFKVQLSQIIRHCGGLEQIARTLNTELQPLVGEEHFITCLLALYEPASGAIEYVNCGHETGLLVSEAEITTLLESTGLPLGVLPDARWETRGIVLNEGDRLCLFTDGLPEAFDSTGALFGRTRLTDLLLRTAADHPAGQAGAVLREVKDFRGPDEFPDDVTLLVIQREKRVPPCQAASTPAEPV